VGEDPGQGATPTVMMSLLLSVMLSEVEAASGEADPQSGLEGQSGFLRCRAGGAIVAEFILSKSNGPSLGMTWGDELINGWSCGKRRDGVSNHGRD